ncbi:MAG TPA: class I SAM-dependent methyltransferase [Chthoniobacterales bacterium]|nr:class I SAM-dependent methyltransferase [Chthoniobacterales bacterium]
MDRKQHWTEVYQQKAPDDVSWYQPRPELSLGLIRATGADKDAGVIDVGGGASTLIDCLLEDGYSSLAVFDISAPALSHARVRLGERAAAVEWFEGDVTSFEPPHRFAVWHDRALFHFLTEPGERRAYVSTLQRTLQPGGHVIIATFALDGPPKCSGLPVMRHDEASIEAELGASFVLRESRRETHTTPWQTEQRFLYLRFQQV